MYIKLRRNVVILKYCKFIFSLLLIFWDVGLIGGFKYKKEIKVLLRYKKSGKPVFAQVGFISNLKSKNFLNIYNFYKNYYNIKIFNFIVVWTNIGLMLLKNAIKKGFGGFLFFKFI